VASEPREVTSLGELERALVEQQGPPDGAISAGVSDLSAEPEAAPPETKPKRSRRKQTNDET